VEGGERLGKEDGGLDLDFVWGPEFLVTPLQPFRAYIQHTLA